MNAKHILNIPGQRVALAQKLQEQKITAAQERLEEKRVNLSFGRFSVSMTGNGRVLSATLDNHQREDLKALIQESLRELQELAKIELAKEGIEGY